MGSDASDLDPGENDPGVDSSEASEPGNRESLSLDDIEATNLDELTEDDLKKIPCTRKHLSLLRVRELRQIAREACGPGTWISHASKDELIDGAIQGRPPRSTHKEDRGSEPSEDSFGDSVSEDDGSAAPLSARVYDTDRSLPDLLFDLTKEVRSELKETSMEELEGKDVKQAVLNSLPDGFPEELGGAVLGIVAKITKQIVEHRIEVLDKRIGTVEEELGIEPSGKSENQPSGERELPGENGPSDFEEDLGTDDPQMEDGFGEESSGAQVTQDYAEGAQRQVEVTRYERDPAAREACIDHYGTRCYCCGVDLGEKYGEIGEGYVQVHHETPLSEVDDDHEVDPIRDLKPLCPNCHVMVHRGDPLLAPGQLRQMMELSEG